MKRSAALLLTFIIAAMMAASSADYFFRHPFYETGDAAANSLAVDRAKHFAEIYGAYSRWGFHHPGPAFFYVQALGERLFFDVLRVVPAPYNAQALVCLLMEVGFFVGALQIFIHWLPSRCRWWFFPMVVAAAALHFGNAPPGHPEILPAATAFQTTWPPHIVVLVFLCMLAASASVAAGRAEDLPLLVIAGGCLVHAHVAQPLFVLPCALLAYAGLIVQHHTDRQGQPDAVRLHGWRQAGRLITEPWRRSPRAHLISALTLTLFVLPIAVDLARGTQSNFLLILDHLRTYKGQHKPFWQSVLYFLQFGAYRGYRPDTTSFDEYDAAGIRRYLKAHTLFYAGWAVVFGLALSALARQVRALVKRRPTTDLARFLAWAGGYLLLAVVLTLRWGVMQDGEMYYYNAWFNFGIYFFAVMIAVATTTRLLLAWLKRLGDQGSGLFERIATVLTAIVCTMWFASRLKIVDPSWSERLAVHDRVARVIAEQPAARTVKFLEFQEPAWQYAAGVALQLERAGERFVVPARWGATFGAEHTWRESPGGLASSDLRKWEFLGATGAKPGQDPSRSPVTLMGGFNLMVDLPAVFDLNSREVATIDCRTGAAQPDFEFTGWTDSEPWGKWINGKHAVLTFRAVPVDGDVELTLQAVPRLVPAHGLSAQRLRVSFNGERVGPEIHLDRADSPPVVLTIPEAVWNRAKGPAVFNAVLEFDLPDAISLQALDPTLTGDPRALALGVSQIRFRRLGSDQMIETPGSASPTSVPPGPAAGGGAPSEYVFDGKPVPPGVSGIYQDGWAGGRVTALLPRTAGDSAPFLRVEGVMSARPGLPSPYGFALQVNDGGTKTKSMIESPGAFEVLVPLPLPDGDSATRNMQVQLTFPQTFSPAKTMVGSHDERELSVQIHSLRITGAAQEVFARLGSGWYDREADKQHRWRWGRQESVVDLGIARPGTLVIKGEAGTPAADNDIDLLLDGMQFTTVPMKAGGWVPLDMRVPVTAGKHTLILRSRQPGQHPQGDERTIALGLRDPEFNLE